MTESRPMPEGLATGGTVSGTMTRPIIIATCSPPITQAHPCARGLHLWAWLAGGGQACGHCGKPRR